MDLFLPYGFTPYDGETTYGIFSTMEKAKERLEIAKKERHHSNYDIYVLQLDDMNEAF